MAIEDYADQKALEAAFDALENNSFLIRLADLIGTPIDKLMKSLPKRSAEVVEQATTKALTAATKIALSSMNWDRAPKSSPWWHRSAVTLTGGAGGFFGLPGLLVELPLSTLIMLRSIADIARAEGENLQEPGASLACLEVFALGGRGATDDKADSGYFTVRAALAKTVSEAVAYVVEKGAVEEGAPVLLRLITKVAQRFIPTVADKAAAQAAPVIGAVGGAGVNLVFLNHFQSVAQGHFTVRRLERKYGEARIREEYERLRKS